MDKHLLLTLFAKFDGNLFATFKVIVKKICLTFL